MDEKVNQEDTAVYYSSPLSTLQKLHKLINIYKCHELAKKYVTFLGHNKKKILLHDKKQYKLDNS